MVAFALEPLRQIAGPDPFAAGRDFTVKIDIAVVGIDNVLAFTRVYAEPPASLPGGWACGACIM